MSDPLTSPALSTSAQSPFRLERHGPLAELVLSRPAVEAGDEVVSVLDVIGWVLGNFQTVAEVKEEEMSDAEPGAAEVAGGGWSGAKTGGGKGGSVAGGKLEMKTVDGGRFLRDATYPDGRIARGAIYAMSSTRPDGRLLPGDHVLLRGPN